MLSAEIMEYDVEKFLCCFIEVLINVCAVCGKREMWGYFPVVS